MNDIRRVLRKAAWRVWAIALGRALTVAATAVLTGLILLRLVQRTTALEVPWIDVAIYASLGAALAAVVWTIITRADRAAVARRVDEGADLRETLSTALWVERKDDPWSRAALESAAERARGVNVKQAVPLQPPRFWPAPFALGLAFLIVMMTVPPIDLFGSFSEKQQKQDELRRMLEAKMEADKATQKVEELMAQLDPGRADDKGPEAEADRPAPRTPEEVRREAIRKLTSLKDRLEEIKNSEKSEAMKQLEKQLKQLRTPGEGPLSELSKELARGNFDKAAEELQKLMEQMQNSQMSEEQKQRLAEQLSKLAEQFQKLAEERKEMEQALEKAGLDKQLAKDPQALKEALEKAENLTDEQKEELKKMAEAAEQACQMCQNMGESMSQMAKGMSQEGMSQDGMEGMESLMDQLGSLEQMAMELRMADAASSECQSQLDALSNFAMCENPGMGEGMCEGGLYGSQRPWSPGWSDNQGMGQGGPGQGQGGSMGVGEADFKLDKSKVQTHNQGGPIISSRLVQGDQIRGESTAEFGAVVTSAEQRAAESLEQDLIPREYHDAVKHYFGRLKARAKVQEITDAPPAPAPPAANDAGGK